MSANSPACIGKHAQTREYMEIIAHLDPEAERMLAMLLRLKDLRQGTVPG